VPTPAAPPVRRRGRARRVASATAVSLTLVGVLAVTTADAIVALPPRSIVAAVLAP
jgi:hypothetical protein